MYEIIIILFGLVSPHLLHLDFQDARAYQTLDDVIVVNRGAGEFLVADDFYDEVFQGLNAPFVIGWGLLSIVHIAYIEFFNQCRILIKKIRR